MTVSNFVVFFQVIE